MSTLSLSTALASASQASPSSTTATQSSTQSTSAQSQAASGLGQISSGLNKAHQRLSTQLQAESASISQLGQFKATLSSLSGVAGALSGVGAGLSAAEVVKKAEAFVAAYNAAVNAAVQQSKGSSNAASSDASQAMAESRRALGSSDASRSQLSKLGFARQADGTLKLDTSVLKKALASDAAGTTGTLAQMGKATAKRAEAELSGDGRIAQATQRASGRAQALKLQQNALVTAANQIAQPQTTGGSSWVARQALKSYTSA